MAKGNSPRNGSDTSANLGFEAKLWLSADKLRNNMDAAKPSEGRQPERSGDSPAHAVSKRTGQTAASSPKGERGGVHQFGVPPKGNANFAWVQHFIHHLAPHGMAGFVLANGIMSSNQSGDCNARSARPVRTTNSQGLGSQRDIRQKLIETDLVDCMVALPDQHFYSTQIPVCLWFEVKKNALEPANDSRLFDGETELRLVA